MRPISFYWTVAFLNTICFAVISHFMYKGSLGISLVISLVMFLAFAILQDNNSLKTKLSKKNQVLGVLILSVVVLGGLSFELCKFSENYPVSLVVTFYVIFIGLSVVCYYCNISGYKKWEEDGSFHYNLLVHFFYWVTVALVIKLGFDVKSAWFYFPLILGIVVRYLVFYQKDKPNAILAYLALFNLIASMLLITSEVSVETSALEKTIWTLVRTISIGNYFCIWHQVKSPVKYFI